MRRRGIKENTMPLLTILLLLPLVTAGLIAFAPARSARTLAVAGAALTLLASLLLVGGGSPTGANGFAWEENHVWLPAVGVHYHVGVDGASTLLILLTTVVQLLATLYSFRYVTENPRPYFALLMALESAIIGSFCALDLILFYAFFEACLVPPYFLIGIWGGKRRVQAATKFFVYTVVGSLLMLAAIIGVYLNARTNLGLAGATFDVVGLHTLLAQTPLPLATTLFLFAGFAVAFAVKTGVFPFHTWLPDTYAEAPPAVAAVLTGLLAKLGTYGFYRFCIFLFPEAAHVFAPYMVALGVVSIVYGALVATVQRDLRRVLAYSSISHLGFVVVGLFAFTPQALSGAILQMVNHGISASALFLLAGMILERRGTTVIRQLGGLWEQMPVFGRVFLIVVLSSIALPLTNGFVGEFLILLGAFQTYPWATAIATTGVIWSAVYMLWMFQRVMYGPVDKPMSRRLRDIGGLDWAVLAPAVALIFLLGIFPALASRTLDGSLAQALGGGRTTTPSPAGTTLAPADDTVTPTAPTGIR